MVHQLLEIARRWDDAGSLEVHEESNRFVLEFSSPREVRYSHTSPVNVASVPQRSPFRYPGGKTWLVPYAREWLRKRPRQPVRLIEPFAGGAIISLTTAFEALAKQVIFAESDEGVAAVWRVILNGHADWLASKIVEFDLTEHNVRDCLSSKAASLQDLAFQTILRNRVQRGGIMAPGAGLVKLGEDGRGLKSRWYPETLARRIREINHIKDKMSFVQGDGMVLIEEHQADKDAAFYIDPPYTVAARRLYVYWQLDHERLFHLMERCRGDFLMSYDNTAEIAELARRHHFEARPIAMKNTHHAKMTELLIGKDLSWMD